MSIVIENLSYVYSPKTPFEHKALDNISLTVEDGDFLGIIGATGSGKSTFIQHLNGLIKLTTGKITVDGIELHNKPDLKKLRAEVGMVFQYPEYQLFDETVKRRVVRSEKSGAQKGRNRGKGERSRRNGGARLRTIQRTLAV